MFGKAFMIKTCTGSYDGYSEDTIFITTDGDVATEAFEQIKRSIASNLADIAMGNRNRADSPEHQAAWRGTICADGVELVMETMRMDMTGEPERVKSEYIPTYDRLYKELDESAKEAYDHILPTRYEVMAFPFEQHFFGWRH